MPDPSFILMGRIVGAHGIAGGLKVLSYAESLAVFAAGRTVVVRSEAGVETVYEIAWSRAQGRAALLGLKGVANRSQAEALLGCDLFLDKATLPKLEEGSYYWADLIGLEVHSVDGDCLGRIASIIQTGSNDVYVVKLKDRELLLPALRSVVQSVDLAARRMVVAVPEGLE
ncbi:MAG: ribosome maturation factor RimM [Desulfobacterales bacterium]|nr:ribosome maturation factor RimM [Desulfobacterales bacterium]